MTIASNLAHVRAGIDAACRAAGRRPDQVRLLPVSKTKPAAAIREAMQEGYLRFGENTVQEVVAKSAELAGTGAEFAVIGHLQTNKARQVAELASEFQALDSLRLATELNRRCVAAARSLDVLVQVNSSGEQSKFGLPPDEVVGFARELSAFEALSVRGLMTVALPGADPAPVVACFQRMQRLQQQLRDAAIDRLSWDELSMGMSGDYELAIAHGSTCVRVGRAIFGARDYGPAA